VASASEPGMIVTNGMSEFARDKENANSALVVSVEPGDFEAAIPWPVLIFRESGKGWLLLRAVPATGHRCRGLGILSKEENPLFWEQSSPVIPEERILPIFIPVFRHL